MDQTQLTNLKVEINALATFLSDYDKSILDYLSGSTSTCVHYLDIINNLKNDTAVSIAYDGASSGQSSSYGALANFVFEVAAIQRSSIMLNMTKSTYYTHNDAQKIADDNYNKGESARTITYVLGNSPEQGVLI